MLFTFYPLLLWLGEPRVKVHVKAFTSLLRLFTSAAHGLFTIELVLIWSGWIFQVLVVKAVKRPEFVLPPGHGCTYSFTEFSHGCAYVLTDVPSAIQIFDGLSLC